eukprot:14161320-Alexandrium_andersonii.AAC.1
MGRQPPWRKTQETLCSAALRLSSCFGLELCARCPRPLTDSPPSPPRAPRGQAMLAASLAPALPNACPCTAAGGKRLDPQ